jgi:ethanolamine permease
MAVFGAVISYLMQMVAFVLLRRNDPTSNAPTGARSDEAGAIVAGVIAAISLVSLFFNDEYRPGVVGVAIWYVLAVVYFAISGRNKLILSPEEEFAMTGGEHGAHLETEGTGRQGSDITNKPPRP